MQTSKNVSIVFNGNRMVVSVFVPRKFEGERTDIEAVKATSLTDLSTALSEAVDTYVNAVQIVNHDAPVLSEFGQNEVSEGERTAADKDCVTFFVITPKRLAHGGVYGEAAQETIKAQMALIRGRVVAKVTNYWKHAIGKIKCVKSKEVTPVTA